MVSWTHNTFLLELDVLVFICLYKYHDQHLRVSFISHRLTFIHFQERDQNEV